MQSLKLDQAFDQHISKLQGHGDMGGMPAEQLHKITSQLAAHQKVVDTS